MSPISPQTAFQITSPIDSKITLQPESQTTLLTTLQSDSQATESLRRAEVRNSLAERKYLIITSIAGAAESAARLGAQLRSTVDAVGTRREALAALRGRDYAAIIVDDTLTEADPAGAELLRKHAGHAIVLEVNFAIAGVGRIAREIRAEMHRREREQGAAMRLASSVIDSELRAMVAGLLLQSQLALAEPGVSPQLSIKLQQIVQLADNLRQRLERGNQRSS